MPVIDDVSREAPAGAAGSPGHPATPAMGEATSAGDAAAAHGGSSQIGRNAATLTGGETPAATLARLRAEAQRMKEAKKTLQRNLRNARRQNARLKAKARKLSDSELLQIVAMRNGVAVVSAPTSTASSSSEAMNRVASNPEGASTDSRATTSVRGSGRDMEEDASADEGHGAVDMERLGDRMEL